MNLKYGLSKTRLPAETDLHIQESQRGQQLRVLWGKPGENTIHTYVHTNAGKRKHAQT